jgi:DNA-binding NarL/FixJ family response regulator
MSEISLGPDASPSSAPASTADGAAEKIGLVLAGPHPLTLYGLSQVFQHEPDCSVLAVCTGIETMLDAVRRCRPNVLVLDLDRTTALTALRRVLREHGPTRVVVLAAEADQQDLGDAVRLGASAVVMKEQPPEALVACIRDVHRGERSLAQDAHVNPLVARLAKAPTSMRHVARRLTPREAQIARLAVRGVPTRQIAAHLGLKQGTVKIHLHSIYDKLNVDGRLGLMLVARRLGLT